MPATARCLQNAAEAEETTAMSARPTDDIHGNDVGKASTGTVDWSVYLQNGVIVDLQIRRYRGVTSIDFSELGLDQNSSDEMRSFVSSYLRPGQKRLLPPEIEGQLKSIETLARQNLRDCSFPCDAFDAQGKFVPETAYIRFKEQNEQLRKRFYGVRDKFANDFDHILDRVREDYTVLAREVYLKNHPNVKRANPKYVRAFVDAIVGQMPPKSEIVDSFEYNTYLRRIPDALLTVIRKKNTIDERVMKIASTTPPLMRERDTRPSIQAVGDLGQVKAQIERDLIASVEGQSHAVAKEFVTDVTISLRQKAYDGATQIITSIDNNQGKLVGRASIRAHSLINELRQLDFYGDSDLQETVDWLEDELDGQRVRNVQSVRAAAEAMRTWAKESAEYIGRRTGDQPQPVSRRRLERAPILAGSAPERNIPPIDLGSEPPAAPADMLVGITAEEMLSEGAKKPKAKRARTRKRATMAATDRGGRRGDSEAQRETETPQEGVKRKGKAAKTASGDAETAGRKESPVTRHQTKKGSKVGAGTSAGRNDTSQSATQKGDGKLRIAVPRFPSTERSVKKRV